MVMAAKSVTMELVFDRSVREDLELVAALRVLGRQHHVSWRLYAKQVLKDAVRGVDTRAELAAGFGVPEGSSPALRRRADIRALLNKAGPAGLTVKEMLAPLACTPMTLRQTLAAMQGELISAREPSPKGGAPTLRFWQKEEHAEVETRRAAAYEQRAALLLLHLARQCLPEGLTKEEVRAKFGWGASETDTTLNAMLLEKAIQLDKVSSGGRPSFKYALPRPGAEVSLADTLLKVMREHGRARPAWAWASMTGWTLAFTRDQINRMVLTGQVSAVTDSSGRPGRPQKLYAPSPEPA